MCMYLKKRRKKRPRELLFIRNDSSLQLSATFPAPSFESHKIGNWIIIQKLLRRAIFNQRRWSKHFHRRKSKRFLLQESWRNWVWRLEVKRTKTESEPARRRGGTWVCGWIGRKWKYCDHYYSCFALHTKWIGFVFLFLPDFGGLGWASHTLSLPCNLVLFIWFYFRCHNFRLHASLIKILTKLSHSI